MLIKQILWDQIYLNNFMIFFTIKQHMIQLELHFQIQIIKIENVMNFYLTTE